MFCCLRKIHSQQYSSWIKQSNLPFVFASWWLLWWIHESWLWCQQCPLNCRSGCTDTETGISNKYFIPSTSFKHSFSKKKNNTLLLLIKKLVNFNTLTLCPEFAQGWKRLLQDYLRATSLCVAPDFSHHFLVLLTTICNGLSAATGNKKTTLTDHLTYSAH